MEGEVRGSAPGAGSLVLFLAPSAAGHTHTDFHQASLATSAPSTQQGRPWSSTVFLQLRSQAVPVASSPPSPSVTWMVGPSVLPSSRVTVLCLLGPQNINQVAFQATQLQSLTPWLVGDYQVFSYHLM